MYFNVHIYIYSYMYTHAHIFYVHIQVYTLRCLLVIMSVYTYVCVYTCFSWLATPQNQFRLSPTVHTPCFRKIILSSCQPPTCNAALCKKALTLELCYAPNEKACSEFQRVGTLMHRMVCAGVPSFFAFGWSTIMFQPDAFYCSSITFTIATAQDGIIC